VEAATQDSEIGMAMLLSWTIRSTGHLSMVPVVAAIRRYGFQAEYTIPQDGIMIEANMQKPSHGHRVACSGLCLLSGWVVSYLLACSRSRSSQV
jgi:hypothetical protein